MGKPQARAIPSDDCAVTIDGVVYHPHEGETVTMFSGQTIGEQRAMLELQKLGTIIEAAEGDPAEQAAAIAAAERYMRTLCEGLAGRVVAWTWTDLRGEPMPQPDGTADFFNRLEADEIKWLIAASKGETEAQRKNASGAMPTTSSASPSRRTAGRPSGTAPSLTKVG